MGAGLMNLGAQQNTQTMQNYSALSRIKEGREQTNDNLQEAEKNQRLQMTMAGAGTGAAVGGPWGAAIGAGVGFAASYFL